jgi:hypothetical protein
MAKYSALVVGCGNMGVLNDAPGSGNEEKIISYAKALKDNGNFEVFCYDNDFEKRNKASDIWKISWQDSLKDTCFDVVIVATPDESHYSILKNILEFNENTKLVICEKPLCNTSKEAREIVKLYEQAGIPILLDYTRRFIPCLIDLNKHAKALRGLGIFNRGALHTATHMIDFFNMLEVPEDKQYIVEHDDINSRVWHVSILFEDGYIFTEKRCLDDPVQSYYDFHTQHIIDNAYMFLEGNEELRCTMYDGLHALEQMERLCK